MSWRRPENTAAVLLVLTVTATCPAFANDAIPSPSRAMPSERKPEQPPPSSQPTLDLTLSYSTAYVYRGYNVFQTQKQSDQNGALRPRVVWTDAADRLSVGYAAVYQVNGDNQQENIADGVGSDQIVFADYELRPARGLDVTPEMAIYLYPQASSFPVLVEPSVELWYHALLEVGAYVSYLSAVRPGPLSENYVYVSSRFEKGLSLADKLEFAMYVSGGVKLFRAQNGPLGGSDNLVDLLILERLRYALTPMFYVEAKGAIAWTNLSARTDAATLAVVVPGFVDECAPYLGLTVGAEL